MTPAKNIPLQPGMLCVIVKSAPTGPQNVGKVVELLHCLGHIPKDTRFVVQGRLMVATEDGVYWWVRCPTKLHRTHISGSTTWMEEGHLNQCRLLPIPPDEALDTEQTTKDKEITT